METWQSKKFSKNQKECGTEEGGMFRRHWRVAGPCAPICNALCVCVLILISYGVSRRDNYPHDSFSTAPCSINIQLYIRDVGRVDG
jgi:hypothetical protein